MRKAITRDKKRGRKRRTKRKESAREKLAKKKLEKQRKAIQRHLDSIKLSLASLTEEQDRCEFLIKKAQEILERTEDTVCNVLLAIRQNEFLQAWYPAQKGHPEMKVIGNHPESAVSKKYD